MMENSPKITEKDVQVMCLLSRLTGISDGSKAGTKYWNNSTEIGFIKKVVVEQDDEVKKIARQIFQILYPDFYAEKENG